jgi:hypothetical protein
MPTTPDEPTQDLTLYRKIDALENDNRALMQRLEELEHSLQPKIKANRANNWALFFLLATISAIALPPLLLDFSLDNSQGTRYSLKSRQLPMEWLQIGAGMLALGAIGGRERLAAIIEKRLAG